MYNTNAPIQQPYSAYQMQQPYQINRPIYQQAPTLGLKGRPVASIEEVRGSIIDFDGSTFYFPDLANKKIYTKQINMDGTATLNVYELQEVPVSPEPQYVTREEFEAAIQALKNIATPAPVAEEPQVPVEAPKQAPAANLLLNF